MSPLRSPASSAGDPGLTSAIVAPSLRLPSVSGLTSRREMPIRAALDAPLLDDLAHHSPRHVNRDRKADPNIAAARRNDGRVDADEFSIEVNQRAARIARVDRGVGLDEVLIALLAKAGPTERANEAGGHGLTKAKGVADGDDKIADLERIAVAERNCLERDRSLNPQDRNVGGGIAPDNFRRELPAVFGLDPNRRYLIDNVVVGQDIATLGVDDDAGASGVDFLLKLLRDVEKLRGGALCKASQGAAHNATAQLIQAIGSKRRRARRRRLVVIAC